MKTETKRLLNTIIVILSILLFSCGAEDMFGRLMESGIGYHVTYHANGGTAGSVPVDDNLYAPDATVTVLGNTGNLARLGYTFNDWNTASDGSGTTYTETAAATLTGSDLILYARWLVIPTNNVNYDANGGLPVTSVPFDPVTYQYNQVVTVMGKPTDLIHPTIPYFIGWNTLSNGTGTNYTRGQTFMMGLDPVTLYANWTNTLPPILTYTGTGSTAGTIPVDPAYYASGSLVTVLGNTGNLTRSDGYYFTCWNDGATNYYAYDTFTITGDVTLSPVWVNGTTYTVTYNANLADSGTAPVDYTYYQLNDDPPVLQNTGNLVRAGYSFICWNTKSNGSGIDFEPGSISGSGIIDINDNIILYARWSFPVMVDEDFNGDTYDSSQFAVSGVSISGGVVNIPSGAGIKSRLFKIPVIIEGRANIQDSSDPGIFEYFCIRQVPDIYSSTNPIFQFGFASGLAYSYINADVIYWDSPTTTHNDPLSSAYIKAVYHVFRIEIYNNIQYYYIDNVLVRTTYYSFLSNTWWNFIMRGDSSTAALLLDWIKIYTSRPGDTDPVWP